jgi:hypothetical protein
VYSLTLPQMWESRWEPPQGARRGIPRPPVLGADYAELWRWLAILGAAGLVAEWILFGRLRRGFARVQRLRGADPLVRASSGPPASHPAPHEEVRRT